MKTVIDVENTIQWLDDGRKDGSPYNSKNYLVSCGVLSIDQHVPDYYCFRHDTELPTKNGANLLQQTLDRTKLLIGHNIKYDLKWLWACNFIYSGQIYDTMIHEFLKAGGQHVDLDLTSCCLRHNLAGKLDSTKEYLDKKIGFEAMPWDVVREYGMQDCISTKQLYLAQTNACV